MKKLIILLILAMALPVMGQGSAIPHPNGSDTQVQYNNGGVFGGDISLTWDDGAAKALTIAGGAVIGLNSAIFQPTTDATTFFQVLDADGGTPILSIDTILEYVGFGTPAPATTVEVYTQNSSYFPFMLTASAASPIAGFVGRTSRGTYASPTATQKDDFLFALAGRGHDGTIFETSSTAIVSVYASENHSATNQGSYLTFETTPSGSTAASRAIAVIINQDGKVGLSAARLYSSTVPPSHRLHVVTESNTDGVLIQRNSGTTGEFASLYFKTAATNFADQYIKGGIFFEDSGESGARGHMHLCVDSDSASSNVGVSDNVITLTSSRFVGITEQAPETLLELTHATPYITLHNSTHEDSDGGRESKLIFKGEDSGTGEESTLATIVVAHDSAADDYDGKVTIAVHDSAGGVDAVVDVLEIDSNLNTKIGDGGTTNYTKIEADGTIEFNGAATVWNDINVGAVMLALPAANLPDEDEYVDEAGADTGISTWAYAIGEKSSGSLEMPHDYKEGSDIYFHIHYQGITAPGGGTDNIKWQLTYTVAQDGQTLDAATIITKEEAYTTQYSFVLHDFAAITGTNFNIEDQFLFTIERIAASADDYAGDCLVSTVGLHYECDTAGSRAITTK